MISCPKSILLLRSSVPLYQHDSGFLDDKADEEDDVERFLFFFSISNTPGPLEVPGRPGHDTKLRPAGPGHLCVTYKLPHPSRASDV